MATGSGKGTFQPDSDVHITFEDQQKINKFARLNAQMEDLKDEMKVKENDLKNLEDACDEIALLDDDDDDDDDDVKVPYLIGEVFIYQDIESTQASLDDAKKETQQEIEDLKQKCSNVKDLMGDLKSLLYGKFGSHINLEADDD